MTHGVPSHNPPAGNKMKVVVVDDERLSSHNLNIQLKFIGETPVLVNSETWTAGVSKHAGKEEVLAFIFGTIKNKEVAALLADVQAEYPDSSKLLLGTGNGGIVQGLKEPLRSKVQLLEVNELNYQSLSRALTTARRQHGLAPNELKSKLLSPTGSALFRSLTGTSRAIQRIRDQVQQVARHDVTVLILGESGTGKEVVARNLHYHSGRGDEPFVAVNCAAIHAERHGVELFGQAAPHGREASAGLLEKAQGGTLYLDEVAALPLNIQTLLLRFLEDKTFHRNGGGELLTMDVRVVAASGQRLEPIMKEGRFRKDLFYRLNLMPIELPPLRQRIEDIPDLVKELLRSLESKGYKPVSLNAQAVEALQKHKWHGNVRELANLVERLCIMHPEGIIGVGDLPLEYQDGDDTDALLQEIEALSPEAGATEAKAEVKKASPPAQKPGQTQGQAKAQPAKPQGKGDAGSAMMPLNEMLLQHYLYNFEKQLLLTALDDSANILSFAAERLNIDEAELTSLMQTYQLESF